MKKPHFEDIVKAIWNSKCEGSLLFRVATKIKKKCRLGLLQWNRQQQENTIKQIQLIKTEMGGLKEQGGHRDWEKWNTLKIQLDEAHKEEEAYWSQKAGVQWLEEGDKNTQYFHASTIQRRKANRTDHLEKENEKWCYSDEEIVEEIAAYYSKLYISSDSFGWDDKVNGIATSIIYSMNSYVIKPMENDEIKKAIFSINPTKAPGMDGMILFFF